MDISIVLNKCFHAGELHWQQGDSEYVSQNKKADATYKNFCLLRDEAVEYFQSLESERDELKSKLAELDNVFCIEDQVIEERDAYHEVADRLAAVIADIYQQDIGEHSSANCPWIRALQLPEEYELPKPPQPIANNSEQQRITEQDAREIANCFIAIEDHDWYDWLTENGNTLLAKLNGDENA